MAGMEVQIDRERKGVCNPKHRVNSLENLLKKLGWEKSAAPAKGNLCEREYGRALAYRGDCIFQMPLNYPRYSKGDYESMAEWKLDLLFQEYGLPVTGDLIYKRNFAIGSFLWPQHA